MEEFCNSTLTVILFLQSGFARLYPVEASVVVLECRCDNRFFTSQIMEEEKL